MDLVKSFYASPLLSSWHLKPKQRPEENTSSPTLYFSNFMIMSVKKRVLFLCLFYFLFKFLFLGFVWNEASFRIDKIASRHLFPPISPKFQSDILSNSSHYSIIISSSKLYTFTKEFSVRWKKWTPWMICFWYLWVSIRQDYGGIKWNCDLKLFQLMKLPRFSEDFMVKNSLCFHNVSLSSYLKG